MVSKIDQRCQEVFVKSCWGVGDSATITVMEGNSLGNIVFFCEYNESKVYKWHSGRLGRVNLEDVKLRENLGNLNLGNNTSRLK